MKCKNSLSLRKRPLLGKRPLLLVALVMMLSLLAVHPAAAAESPAQTDPKTTQTKLAWTQTYKSFKAGASRTFKVNKAGAVFTSSSTAIATVGKNTGKVVGKQYGTTTIKASVGKETVSFKLEIKPKKIIGIDPGHQARANSGLEPIGPGSSTKKIKVAGGTQGVATGLPEYKLTLQVAKKLKKTLIKRGYKVVMTRSKNNVDISNKKRAQKLNKKCDIAIRLHADAAGGSTRGVSVLYPSGSNPYLSKSVCKKSKKLSRKLLDAYCKKTGLSARGIVTRDDLTGTNWSKIPVALIEMGFMTNATEDRFMASKAGQKKMVKGIANGVDAYFGY